MNNKKYYESRNAKEVSDEKRRQRKNVKRGNNMIKKIEKCPYRIISKNNAICNSDKLPSGYSCKKARQKGRCKKGYE